MKAHLAFLVCLLLTNLLRAQEPSIRVVIVAGQDEIHNINQKIRTEPVVEVQDENLKPVQGANVVFTMPTQGAGGTFENGSNMLTTITDKTGRAVAHGLRLNKQLGPFTIHVTASNQGHTANAVITQTNVSGKATSAGTFGVSNKAWIILGVCVIGIAGAVIAVHNATLGSNPNNLTITTGIPVVGAPQ